MNEPRGDRARWPRGLLGALALIGVFEAVVARHDLDFTVPTLMEWRQSRRASAEHAPGHRVLSLGTSMTKLGLYAPVVERESGRSTYNLACCAGRIPGSYFLLRRAIQAGARPESIVLEVHPTYLAMPFQDGLVGWPELLDPAESLELAWSGRDASFFARTILAQALPSLNARQEIRAAIVATLQGQALANRPTNRAILRNFDQNSGSYVRRGYMAYHGEISPHLEGMYLPRSWACRGVNELYLRRLLDLCRSKEIQVYLLIPPMIPELQARREQLGLDAAYTRFLRKVQRNYPSLVVLDSRGSGFDVPVFTDAAHLDFRGAAILSAEVGRILKEGPGRALEGSRWVNLPPYRDRAIDAPLEDMSQSFQAVARSEKTLKR